MLPSLADQISTELQALRSSSRLRSCPALDGNSRVNVTLDGQQLVSFCSNDYLGLATSPRLLSAASEAAIGAGFGAGASRLVAGNLSVHIALENKLADFLCLPAALLFPTGYQANLGVVTALAGPEDLIVADRAVHASIIDACRLSRAKLAFYAHLDAFAAEGYLARLGQTRRRRFLVTESLFSMDGDVAPLCHLSSIASAHGAALIVDEAHALGCLGPSGRGLCAEFGVRPDVLVGTLGKAFGASGAFVAGTQDLRDYLLNRARTFIFTTALPVPVAAAALAAVRIASSPEGDRLRLRLSDLTTHLRARLGMARDPMASPILPLTVGSDRSALEASHHLLGKGFFVQAIRPPAVREGTARLRITVSALHNPQQVAGLADAIASLHLHRGALTTEEAAAAEPEGLRIQDPRTPASPDSVSSVFTVSSDLKLARRAQRGEVAERSGAGEGLSRLMAEGSGPPPGGDTDLKLPRRAQRGEVAERSEAGEGLSRFMAEGSGPPPGGDTAVRPRSQGIVLLGTDTGVGKTTVAAALLHILVSRGLRPVPFKPVETGADPLPSDATRLLSASRRDDIPLTTVCPLFYREPVAPAAATVDQPITLSGLLAHARAAAAFGTPLVIETAGGILSPYAPCLTPADLATALGFPVLLIARNGLGTINHTALAIAEIRRRALPLLGVVLVTTAAATTPDQRSNFALIRDATGLAPLGVLPFVESRSLSQLAAALQANVDFHPILDSLAI